MKIIVFEDQNALNLEPISLTRPVFDIRFGAETFLERIQRLCPDDDIGLWVRDELYGVTKEFHPDCTVNESRPENTLWLNACAIWGKKELGELKQTPSSQILKNEICLGANLSHEISGDWLKAGGPQSIFSPTCENEIDANVQTVGYLWDLLSMIPSAVEEASQIKIEPKKFEQVIIDETEGPVIVDGNVTVEPFTYLKGPLYLGKDTLVASHSKIKCSIIGPNCKIGGEVSGIIIQGFTNKVHDGYLGDSFLGEWVNLGAGTTNSNLKNTYSSVSMVVNGELVESDKLFLGSVIGDHSKTAIGTQLNTGTNIGVGCNVVSQAFPKRYIPSFTFCIHGKHRKQKFDDFIEMAQLVKKRRNQHLTLAESKMLKKIFTSQ